MKVKLTLFLQSYGGANIYISNDSDLFKLEKMLSQKHLNNK